MANRRRMKSSPRPGLFRLVATLFAGFLPLFAAAQSSITYTPTFTASGVNMWGSGVSTVGASYFYGTSWNVSGSIGSIAETAIGDFGGRIFGSTSGTVGVGVQLAATAGHVDVNLPYRVTISSATNLTNAGNHTLNISSSLASLPSGNSYVSSKFASAGFDTYARIQATATVGGEIAFFDRSTSSTQVLNIDHTVPITSNNANQLVTMGVPIFSGPEGTTIPLPPPLLSQSVPKLATPGQLTIAPLALDATSGTGLTTSASQTRILGVSADLFALASWAAGLPINPLDTSLSLGPIGFTKRDLSVNVGVNLGLAQDISLTPNLGVILRSSTPLTYNTPGGVVTTNALVVTDLTQPITFNKPAGNVAIFPEFFLTPTLRNNTDLLLTGTFSLDAATYGYQFFNYSGTLGPLYTFDSSITTGIGLVDSTFNVSGTGLNVSQLGRSLTNVPPTVGNVAANQSVAIPGLVGDFTTSSIAAGGRLFLSAGSLYLNTTTLTIAAATADKAAGVLELAAGSGSSANRLDTPGLNNLGLIKTGNGSTLNVTTSGGFANVNASGVLSGGTFDLGGTFTYVGPSLTANQATLTLNYGGTLQNRTTVGGDLGNALATLASNSGTLTLKSALNTGRAFTNTGTLDLYDQLTTTTFANSGLLFVQGGGKLIVTSPNGFTGVNSSGVLSGNYYLAGQIAYQGAVDNTFPVLPGDTPVYFAGHSITTNSGNLTLSGPSIDPRITNQQPDGGVARDALATLANNTGNLILNNGATQRLNQSLTNNGGVGLFDTGTKLSVGGQFTNAAGKTLTIRRGTLEVFNSSFDYNFTNNGILNLEQGGRIEVDGSLGNFSNVNLDARTGTLTGGTWNVGGTIAYGTGSAGAPNIREIGAGTVINMLGGEFYNQFFNQSGLSYLAVNRGTLNLGSSYVLKSNAALTNTGTIALSGASGWLGFVDTLANTGSITIGAGSTLSSLGSKTFADAANWTNVSTGGLLSNIGQLVLAGTLEYKGTAITGLAAGSDLTLSGDSWGFFRKTGSNTGVSGLGLTTLGGALRLANRAKFETPVGSTFTVQSTGTLATSSDSVFIVRQGLLSVAGNATLSNNGVILLQHSGTSPATFSATGNVTLTGTGSLQLTNLATNALADAGGTLTNSATHLIAGAGTVATKLVNRGTVESIGSAGLYFQNGSPSGLVNSGIIRAGSSVTYPVVGNTYDFSQPTVVPSQLTIYNTAVTNFEGATAGRLVAANRMWIGVSTVNGGRVEIPSGGLLTLDDANLLGGVFDLQTSGRVEIYGGRVKLDGTSLSSATGSTLTLLDVGNAVDPAILEITGAQPFLHSGALVMRNNSRLEGSSQFINHGSLLVHQPGVSTVPVINANFRNASDGLIDIDKSSSLRWAGDAFNAGRVNVGASGDNSAGIAGTLSFPGNTTLSGGGEIRLGALVEQTVGGVTSHVWSASGRLTAPIGTAPTLTNSDNTLSGAGTIGDTRLGLINQAAGTVRALGGTLLINPGSGGVTNQGLFRTDAGARLEINTANGAFTNFSATTNTLTGGRYEVAGTLAFTGANLVTNAADLTIFGSGQVLNLSNNANALANFTTNAAGGSFRLHSAATFSSPGAFTNQGTLVVGGSGALAGGTFTTPSLAGSGTVNLADATASLTFNGATGNLTAANSIAGSGQLLKQGASVLILSGTNSYTGGTTLSGGTLQIGAGGTSGAIVGDVTNNAVLVFNRSDNVAFAGVVSGNGSLTQAGTGTLTLSGANTITGSTTVSAGTLQIGAGGTTGSLAGNIVNNAGLRFDRSDSFAYAGTISGNGTLTKTGAGTLSLTGDVAQANVVISAGTVQIGNGGATGVLSGNASLTGNLAFNRTGNSTYAGTASGTGQVSKSGSGTLTVTGNLGHTGGTQVLGGTLEIGGGGTAGSLSGNVANSATLAFNRSDSFTYGGVVSGTGTLVQRGAGTLVLTGAHTFSGGVSLTQGTLVVGHNSALGTGTLSLHGGTLAGDGTSRTLAHPLSLQASSTLAGASALTFSGRLTNAAVSPTLTVTNSALTTFGSIDLSNTSTSRTLTLATTGPVAVDGVIANGGGSTAGALVKTGTGTLTLNGNNTFSGGVTLSAGTLFLGHTSALGTGTLTLNGGTLQSTGGLVVGNAVNLAGNVAFSGNAPALAGSVSLLQTPTLTIATGTGVTLSGAIGQTGGTYGLTKEGGGSLALTGASTFGGNTTVSGGTLFLARSGGSALAGPLVVNAGATAVISAANQVADSAAITVNGGQLVLSGAAESVGAPGLFLTGGTVTPSAGGQLQFVNGGGITTGASAAPSTISAPVSFSTGAAHTLSVAEGSATADLLISGAISQSGGAITLTKTGAGLLSLTGANSFAGSVTVSAGTLALGHPSALGSAGFTLNGGTLRTDVAVSVSAPVAVLGGSSVINTNGQSLTLSGLVTNGGAFTKTGAGTLSLSGANNYAGGTTLQAGTLSVSHNSALGTGTLALQGGSLQAPGAARALANPLSLQGNFDISNSPALTLSGTATLTGSRTLTIGAGSTATFSGNIVQSGGTFGLTKLGSGTLVLSGANAYGGGTSISAGTVRLANLSGSALGTGAVSVAAGAILTGSGSFTGPLTLAGTLSPGNSPGTLSVGSTTWLGGGAYFWEINDAISAPGVGWDLLSVSGSLAITATAASKFTFSLQSLNPAAGNAAGPAFDFASGANYSFTVATTSGGISGFDPAAFAINASGFANPFAGTWSLAQVGNNLDLVYTGASAIPEPSTYAAVAGAAVLALAAYRRRRTTSN